MDSKLSETEVKEINEAFKFFDSDGDGNINLKDIGTALRALRLNLSESELQEIMNKVAVNGTGTVSFDQFKSMVIDKMKHTSEEEYLRDAFRVFDQNGYGLISADDLKQVMIKLGEKITDEEVNEMIKVADLDGDGYVNYEEFVKIMTSK